MSDTTPMMRQYRQLKRSYPDAILLFRLGDFYETFEDDAKVLSQVLEIALTSRPVGKGKSRIPLAGIPHQSLEGHLGKLVRAGHKVAIAEQVEDAKLAKKLVKRDVVRVVTSGTVFESELLEASSNNYLMAIISEKGEFGIAFVDVSTGEFLATQIDNSQAFEAEIVRFSPVEVLIPNENWDKSLTQMVETLLPEATITEFDAFVFSFDVAYETLTEHLGVLNLEGFGGLESMPLAVSSSGAIIRYLRELQKTPLDNIKSIRTFFSNEFMHIDRTTQRNLEIIRNWEGKPEGTLLSLFQDTKTAMGGRLLRNWLLRPLLSIPAIKNRQEAVEELVEDIFRRQDLREALSNFSDIERLISRIVYGSANARDLVALKTSLELVPKLTEILVSTKSEILDQIRDLDLEEPAIISKLIDETIVPDPPLSVRDGGMIKSGYNQELDEIRSIKKDGRKWIFNLEAQEKKKTGYKNLKVGYNKVHGYYIEVTKANLRGREPPENWIRRQTLVNSERFITPKMKEQEAKVLGAEERIGELEFELFTQVRNRVGSKIEVIQEIAQAVALCDVLSTFAEIAVSNDFVRPEIFDSGKIQIHGGRHPVVERLVGQFIPNDTEIDSKNPVHLITGPNMSGKSTYIRQTALIVLLAQTGCYVPAKSANIGIVDRIFTRVGAFDKLALGQSTFYVEMAETASIMNSATKNSLVILDEVGRGTATYDGLSLAWAIVEFLVDKLKAKTLFATHFHELSGLEGKLPGVRNFQVDVLEKKEEKEMVFLRKIVPGAAEKSFGIHVARMAGLTSSILERADEILETLEGERTPKIVVSQRARRRGKQLTLLEALTAPTKKKTLPESDPEVEKLLEEIVDVDIETTSPLDALTKVDEWKKRTKDVLEKKKE